METVSETPTEPIDYAVISAAYGSLLGAVVLASRSRRTGDPPTGAELVPLGAATFALAKVVAHEKVETWIRAPFVVEAADGRRRPRGRRLRYAVGELMSCTRCLGAWSALALVGVRTASPTAGRTLTAVLAVSAANDWMQAGFSWLCAQSNGSRARP
jgi:hypothetical protein